MIRASQKPWVINSQNQFTGGENRTRLPETMAANQLRLAQNCVMTAEGLVETRKALRRLTVTPLGAGSILGIWRYAKSNGNKYLVVQHGTTLRSQTWDGTSSLGSWTTVKTGLTANSKCRGLVWKDNLILGNGTENIFRFDGTTCTDLAGSPPKSNILTVYAAKLWLVNYANPNILRYSGVENYDVWSGYDVINVRDNDGDAITGLAPVGNGLVVAKSTSLWPVYGWDARDLQVGGSPLSDSVGCISPDVMLDGVLLGQDLFYQFALDSFTAIGKTHQDLIKMNTPAQLATSFGVGIPAQKRAVVALGSGQLLCLDGNYGGITSWYGFNPTCLAVADANGDNGDLLMSDANGHIYIMDGLVDDDGPDTDAYSGHIIARAIRTEIASAYQDFGSHREKVWRRFEPNIEPVGALTREMLYEYDVDGGARSGRLAFGEAQTERLEFGLDPLAGSAAFGAAVNIREPFHFMERGHNISFTVKAFDRIRFLGYNTMYREAGHI